MVKTFSVRDKFGVLVLGIVVTSYCRLIESVIAQQNDLDSGLFQDPGVFITISPEANYSQNGNVTKLLDRRIELNWYNFLDYQQGDYVGLYDMDPTTIPEADLHLAKETVQVNNSMGYHKTSVRYRRQNLTSNSDRCLKHWIAYIKVSSFGNQSKVTKSQCLMIYPTWIKDLKEEIGDKPLHSIMIPGTHNAGAWTHYEGKATENIVTNYVMCQEDSIYEQLIHGIRYLDIRIAYYPLSEEKFWVNHDAFKVKPLIEVISDVRAFVTETNEIVFLDFHNFPIGFDEKVHNELVQFIQKEIGTLLVPKTLTTNVTPNQIWENNKTIILGYAELSISSKYPFLWHNVEHAWGNTNEISTLEKYLNSTIPTMGCTGKFWTAMGELTAATLDVILLPYFGVRGFAAKINLNLTYWYHQQSWYSKSMIVSTDYYLGNNIIQSSYQVNRNKAVCVQI